MADPRKVDPNTREWVLTELEALRRNPSDQLAALVTVSATPPARAFHGQLWLYQASGLAWLFRFNENAATHKWEFLGGGSWSNHVAAAETTSSGTYVNLATAGPALTVPFTGDWAIRHGCHLKQATSGIAFQSVALGAAAATDGESVAVTNANSHDNYIPAAILLPPAALTAADAVACKYKASTLQVAAFRDRWLEVEPIRVSA